MKRIISKSLLIIVVAVIFMQTAFADTPTSMENKLAKLHSKTIPVGTITKNKEGVTVNGLVVPSYNCSNVSYLVVSDLRQVGGNIGWNPTSKKITILDFNQPVNEELEFEILEDKQLAYLARDTVYINYQEIPAIYVNGKTLIASKWLEVLDPAAESNSLKVMNIINIWYDGDNYIEEYSSFWQQEVGRHAYYNDNKYDDQEDYIYVGYVVSDIDGVANNDLGYQKAWLKNPTYHKIPKGISAEELNQIFPPTLVKGVMKYAAGGFAKGQEVHVARAASGHNYYLETQQGKLVEVPWNSVQVKNSPTSKEEASKEQIEQYVNKLNLSSRTSYLVWTDLYRQRTYVFTGSQNNWTLVRSMLSSTGRDITPTPRGRYTLNNRVSSFGQGNGYLAKNAYAFIGSKYLYHSVLFDSRGKYLLEGRGVLGTKASQGCIRFSPEDSEWFYKTMPVGTAILIN